MVDAEALGSRVGGREAERALELAPGACGLPAFNPQHPAEVGVRIGVVRLDGQRPLQQAAGLNTQPAGAELDTPEVGERATSFGSRGQRALELASRQVVAAGSPQRFAERHAQGHVVRGELGGHPPGDDGVGEVAVRIAGAPEADPKIPGPFRAQRCVAAHLLPGVARGGVRGAAVGGGGGLDGAGERVDLDGGAGVEPGLEDFLDLVAEGGDAPVEVDLRSRSDRLARGRAPETSLESTQYWNPR